MEYARETIDADTLMTRVEQLIDQGRPGAARPLLAAARGLAQPSSGPVAARGPVGAERWDVRQRASRNWIGRSIAEPEHAGLRKCRAELRRRLGDLEGAVRDAAEAVILDRDDPPPKRCWANCCCGSAAPPTRSPACARRSPRCRTISCIREMLAQALTAERRHGCGAGDAARRHPHRAGRGGDCVTPPSCFAFAAATSRGRSDLAEQARARRRGGRQHVRPERPRAVQSGPA